MTAQGKRTLAAIFLALGFALTICQAEATTLLATDVAAAGSVFMPSAATAAGNLIDMNEATQSAHINTAVTYGGITWATPQTFDRLILSVGAAGTNDLIIAGFDIQIAKAGVTSPDPAVDADWQTLPGASYTNNLQNGSSKFAPSLSSAVTTSGIRIKVTDPRTFNGSTYTPEASMRTKELWAWQNYDNRALTASVSAPGFDLPTRLNDESAAAQAFCSSTSGAITFSWTAAQPIGAVAIHGGTGATNEYPVNFDLQAWDGAQFQTVKQIRGNSLQFDYITLDSTVTTTQFRVNILSASGGGANPRISEVFLFAPVPEPASLSLLALGGLALLRRRR